MLELDICTTNYREIFGANFRHRSTTNNISRIVFIFIQQLTSVRRLWCFYIYFVRYPGNLKFYVYKLTAVCVSNHYRSKPMIYHGSCSYLIQLLTTFGVFILIMGPLLLFYRYVTYVCVRRVEICRPQYGTFLKWKPCTHNTACFKSRAVWAHFIWVKTIRLKCTKLWNNASKISLHSTLETVWLQSWTDAIILRSGVDGNTRK